MPNLRHIRTFNQLVRYLEDELGWPLDGYGVDDLTFVYEADELGLKPSDAAKVKKIRQLRPLDSEQPWGIFFIEFDRKKLPVVILRRILSHLVVKKRASANQADRAAWSAEDLLFISAFGEEEDGRELTFAHFHQEEGDMPTLRVLGWDGGDTSLKIDHLATTMREKLHWPDGKESLDHWRARWSGVFRHRIGHVINTSDMLAEAMAVLAKRIRDAAQTLIDRETDNGPLRKLHAAFKLNLIHDLTEEGFADTYAQTITYGLLTAAISRTEMSEGRKGTALVASNISDMVPVTNPFLKEMLQTFLHAGGRKGGIDFDELGVQDVVELLRGEETDLPAILRDFGNKTRGDDPVIHFYEHFLNAYNKKLRIQRGVFYTPNPVVSYIVRSVDELLKTEFGLEHGLADTITWGEFIQKSKINNPQSEIKLPPLTDEPGCTETISPDEFFVQILDPATGTATFPVEVIDVIFNYLKDLWKKRGAAAMPSIPNSKTNIQNFPDYWNEYVPKALLPRLHAFELMMAPYAIAHMKVGLKLAETGYNFATEERARIYLTNALEPWQKQLPLIGFDALAHEAAAVNEIKRHKRFTVVIGNPPYSVLSANLSETARRIVDPYRHVKGKKIEEKSMLRLEMHLQDDYIKFLAKAQRELANTGIGMLGFITNNGYLDNLTLRGVRSALLDQFEVIYAQNLHGSRVRRGQAAERPDDRNVFDIEQGVSVFVGSSTICHSAESTRKYGELIGSRDEKYRSLDKSVCLSSSSTALTPQEPQFFLIPRDESASAEYEAYPSLFEFVPLNISGVVTAHDDLVVDFEDDRLLYNAKTLRDSKLTDQQVRDALNVKDNAGWKLERARRQFCSTDASKQYLVNYCFKPFDTRRIYYHPDLVWCDRRNVMQHMLDGKNIALLATRQTKERWGVFVTRDTIAHKVLAAYDVTSIFPLYLRRGPNELRMDSGQSNFSHAFLTAFTHSLSLAPKDLTPEDIFHYAYAVFHSPGYRSRYAEFLKIDFPRLPLTGNLELFRALARLGGELTALHLLESKALDKPRTKFIGKSKEVTKIGWVDDTVWINAGGKKAATTAGTSGFQGVPENVWNFHIGGYQVCEKWLKDRKGRTLTDEDIAHYHKIVIALSETIRLMAEIDQVINQHGGWPGAFAGAKG